MAIPAFSRTAFVEALEPILADAVEHNNPANLHAARDFATLFTDPDLDLYRPDSIFQTFVVHFPPSSFDVHVEHVREELVGDTARMSACVGALVKGIERAPGTTLMVEIFEQEENSLMIPRMGIGFSGPGRIPDRFPVHGVFSMSLDVISDCWTLATSGGRIDRTENGVEFRLHGMRMPPEPLEIAGQVAACLGRAPDLAGAAEALALLEETGPRDMVDLERLLAECREEAEPRLAESAVTCAVAFSDSFPQFPLNRNRMRRAFNSLFHWATDALPEGGALDLLLEYDPATREATGMLAIGAKSGPVGSSPNAAVFSRAIAFHGGAVLLEEAGETCTATFTLADTVGPALDAWIPGWEAFGEESRKYLRLLKSGAQAPPEDFILGGVLEQELERWLLPRLQDPATVNLVNEGGFKNDGLKGSIRERMQKALDQAGRGKPKKEICQPHYAGELFWAFRASMRHRAALGTQVLTDDELRALAEGLLQKPVDARACLALLAALIGR